MSKQRHLIIASLAVLLLVFAAACGTEQPQGDMQVVLSFEPTPNTGKADAPQRTCGTILGLVCDEGYRCEYDGNYPDAGGKCVKETPKDMCQYVKCMQVESCPKGFHVSRRGCCSVCVPNGNSNLPEGQCKTVKDCDGLIHIMSGDVSVMCVGSWTCDAGYCKYSCFSGPVL